MRRLGVPLALALVFLAVSARAEESVITVESVALKNTKGEWVTVLRPDKKINLETTEPSLSFFNKGNVPPGDYVNFKVVLYGTSAAGGEKAVLAKQDLAPIVVKRSSFVRVWFEGHSLESIQELGITVDDTTARLNPTEILRWF